MSHRTPWDERAGRARWLTDGMQVPGQLTGGMGLIAVRWRSTSASMRWVWHGRPQPFTSVFPMAAASRPTPTIGQRSRTDAADRAQSNLDGLGPSP